MTKQILLTQGKVALVSDHRFEYIDQWKWRAQKTKDGKWYAVRSVGPRILRKLILMHRLIMDTPEGMDTDHRDRDGLNNQDDNLRVSTRAQNMCNREKLKNNTSGYKGVSWNDNEKKYVAFIGVSGESIFLGGFIDPIDAAKTYDEAARELHGEFAVTNFGKEIP